METVLLKRPADMQLCIEGALGKRRNSGKAVPHLFSEATVQPALASSHASSSFAPFPTFAPIPGDYNFQCRVNTTKPYLSHHLQVAPCPLGSLPFVDYAPYVNMQTIGDLRHINRQQSSLLLQEADPSMSYIGQRDPDRTSSPDRMEHTKDQAGHGIDPARLALPQTEQAKGQGNPDSPQASDEYNDGVTQTPAQRRGKRIRLPTEKRKAQNRFNQRAFRERRDKHLQELEKTRGYNDQLFSAQQAEIQGLRQLVGQLEAELHGVRKEHLSPKSRPSTGASTSTASKAGHFSASDLGLSNDSDTSYTQPAGFSASSEAGSHCREEESPASSIFSQCSLHPFSAS